METQDSRRPTHARSATQGLAAFVHEASWDAIPQEVRHEARRSLVNYFAVALAGSRDPTLDKAVRTYARFSSGPDARLVGRDERLDMLNAAAINAMSANVYDFDDTHIPTILHPTAPVAAALFAFSETRPMTGRDFLLAFLLGVEAECRIALAISPFHYSKGWHITSTCGVFGSAMAIGRILGLDPRRLGHALGTAATQAGGLVECLGTMSKSVSVGNAARNGMLAALLAETDFDGPTDPLDGRFGFLKVYGGPPDTSVIQEELGSRWEIRRNAYKPYPCGVVLNPVLDACLALAERLPPSAFDVEQVDFIELVGHELLQQRTDRPGVRTGRESQVSAQHAVPVAMLRRAAGLAEFSDAAVADPAVRRLGERVRFRNDNSYSVDAATVIVQLLDGTRHEEHVPIARGAIDRPLTDAELERKLRDLCAHAGSRCDPDALIEAVWRIEGMPDVSQIMRLAASGS